MAAEQPKAPEQAKAAAHGRGGAGNISNKPRNTVGNADLQTPILKSQTYTTGRGGSGNMAQNVSPEEARKAQDVDTPAHHKNDPKGTYHWGRGGEGNMMTVGQKEAEKPRNGSKERRPSNTSQKRTGSFRDAMEKGKDMLGMGRGKISEKNESAVVDD